MIPKPLSFPSLSPSPAVPARSRALAPVRPVAKAAQGQVTIAATGCVTTGTYNQKVAELADHDKKNADTIHSLKAQIKDRDARIAALTAERNTLRKQLADTTALAGELKERMETLGQNVDKLPSEKGQLSTALEALRRQQAAAE